jgi:hypothetical protein
LTDDDVFQQAHDELRRRRQRALWWFSSVIATLFLVSAGLIILSDGPEPDVSDLMPRPLLLRDGENLYAQMVSGGAALLAKPLVDEQAIDETVAKPEPPADETTEGMFGGAGEWQPPKLRERLSTGEGWTAERLALYGPALDGVVADARALLARYPQGQGTIVVDFNTVVPAKNLRAWGEHIQLAAWAKYRAGEQAEAVDRAVLGLHLGRRVRDSRGPLIDYLTGLVIMGYSSVSLESWANLAGTEPATLRRLALRLDELPSARDLSAAYVESLRFEFLVSHRFLRDHVSAAQSAKEGTGMGKAVDWAAKTRVLFPLIYKRNITVALNADGWREEMRWARDSVVETKRKRVRSGGCPHCDALQAPWWQPANMYGCYLAAVAFPTVGQVRITAANAESRVSLLRAAVALRLYSLDHDGALPSTLHELVPEYLPAVPRDYIDNGEIRYSRDARALWSVGVNDLQITKPDQEIKDADREMIYWLKFAAPAETANNRPPGKPNGAGGTGR